MGQLPVFDKYFTAADAEYYTGLFMDNGLQPFVDKPTQRYDAIFGNSQTDLQYILRLPAKDFEKATAILEAEMRKTSLPADYYLHEMSNEELYELLTTPTDWSRQEVLAAKIILESRGYLIDHEKLSVEKQSIKERLKGQRKISVPVLILFYLIAPFGALLPIVIGLIIYNLKETDVDGIKDYVFSKRYRQHGLLITSIGLLSILFWYWYIRYM